MSYTEQNRVEWFGGVGDRVEARGRGFVRSYSPQHIQLIAVSIAQKHIYAVLIVEHTLTVSKIYCL